MMDISDITDATVKALARRASTPAQHEMVRLLRTFRTLAARGEELRREIEANTAAVLELQERIQRLSRAPALAPAGRQ